MRRRIKTGPCLTRSSQLTLALLALSCSVPPFLIAGGIAPLEAVQPPPLMSAPPPPADGAPPNPAATVAAAAPLPTEEVSAEVCVCQLAKTLGSVVSMPLISGRPLRTDWDARSSLFVIRLNFSFRPNKRWWLRCYRRPWTACWAV